MADAERMAESMELWHWFVGADQGAAGLQCVFEALSMKCVEKTGLQGAL